MHEFGFPELMIIGVIVLMLVTARRIPPKTPRPPQHPVPAHEPLHLFLRIKRRCESSWHS